ncbi:hypothetical protein O181_120851 [Austropuccinia psidii MF-1]|uniref:Uncharacterized protein n=1 Tax=Austropuccinia psidii MF-1 TaxID=1389203 RepID=A0A9Q3Q0Y0_9BASI|nr:hypothetical protein [Austropuccinia psidii MF-1]
MTLEMSSKPTALTDSSSSLPPPYVLCGSGIFGQLVSPWFMASSGNFDPHQTCYGYKVVELLDLPCLECLMKGEKFFQNFNPRSSKCHYCFVGEKPCWHPGVLLFTIERYIWRKKDGPFGKEFPVSEDPTPDVTGFRKREPERWTNVEGPIPTCYAEWRDKSDGEEDQVIDTLVGHYSSSSPTQPPSKKFHSQLILRTVRSFQPVLSSVPSSVTPHSPKSFTARLP